MISKLDQKVLINGKITAPKVRLIGLNGEQIGVISLREALRKAEELSIDLVEIMSQANPPVCRIMNYGKYLFEQNKRKTESRKKQKKKMQLKEIKLRPGTDTGDYQVKLRSLIKFLKSGDKVKISIRFRGREMAHQDLGINMLKRLEIDLELYGVVEHRPKMEGRQIIMVLCPKKR